MSLTSQLAALNLAMATLPQKLKDGLAAKAPTSAGADNSTKLNGKTQAQVATDLDGPLNTHVANRLAHGLNATNLDTETSADVDASLAGRPPVGNLPVSRYGSLSYLPPGISGSFEGATTSIVVRDMAMLLEDDGTLTYLRNGINGSRRGVYYAFVKDALGPVFNQPIKTNRRYQPAYFPLNNTAAWIQSCSASVIFGRLQDQNGVLGDWFLSLTNGSYDDTVHTGCFITDAQMTSLGIGRGEILVVDNTVYILAINTDGANVFDVKVWTLPLASVAAGGTLVPTPMTGITTTGFGGQVNTTNGIRLATKAVSTQLSDKPIVHNPNNQSFMLVNFDQMQMRSATDGAGNIRTKAHAMSGAFSTLSSYFAYGTFSWVFNPATKTATLDAVYRATQSVINRTVAGDPSSASVFTGPLWSTIDADEGRLGVSNCYANLHYSGKWLFHFRVGQVTDTLDLTRTQFTNSLAPYDALLRGNAKAVGPFKAVYVSPGYGSAVGGVLLGAFPLSDTRAVVYAKGLRANGSLGEGLAYTDLESTPTFSYNSLNNGAMQGYRPSAVRGFVDEKTALPTDVIPKWLQPVVEASASAIQTSGQNFIEDFKFEAPKVLNPDFTTTGTSRITNALLKAAKNSALAIQNIANLRDSYCQLVAPRVLNCPAFLCIMYTTTAGEGGMFIAPCTLTWSGDDIVGVTVTSVSPRATWTLTATVSLYTTFSWYPATAGAVTLYDDGTSVLVGMPMAFGWLTPGNGLAGLARFRYNKSTGVWNWGSNLSLSVGNQQVNGKQYYASPSLGFGMCYNASPETDYGTKLVFLPITKNSDAAFDSWTEGTPGLANWKVLMSQDVAAVWQLYFTEPTPLLISGRYYTLPIQMVDLSTIKASPGNTTFYIYAQVIAGVASYKVSLTVLTETATLIYLGYVQTGVSTISTIVVDKVTKVGPYRLSPVSRGSAIAVTTGPASNPASLQWS